MSAKPHGVHRRILVLFALLAAGILAAEAGLRDVPRRQAAPVGHPVFASALVREVRAQPARFIDDRRRSAVVEGVVLGRADGLPAADKERFLRSGLWHLLAASGQNVALVVGACMALAWLVGGGRLLATAWALLAVPAYVVVVGGGPSIVRAGVMGELALLAWITGRLRSTWDALLVAACLLVWLAPGSHRSLGMQLSFACVAALLRWCGPLLRTLEQAGMPRLLAVGVAPSVVCSACTAPLLLLRTGEAPLSGALVNVLAVPVASCLLLVGLGAVAAGVAVPVLALPLFEVCGWLASLLLGLAKVGAGLPAASTTSWLPFAVPLLLLAAWRRWRSRRALVACLAAVAAASAGLSMLDAARRPPPPGPGSVRLVILDVGQGSAQLVRTRHHDVLVDTGPPGGEVVRALREGGVRRIDLLVLTHGSRDHTGSARDVMRRFEVGGIVAPRHAHGLEWLRHTDYVVRRVCAGDVVHLEREARLQVLHPPCARATAAVTGDVHNDNALVLRAEGGGARMLLTSDAEGPVLSPLDPGPADVLQVAHHGSADPRISSVIAQVRPRLALISVGPGNSYGHPAASTLQELRAAGVPVLRTDQVGDITVEASAGRLAVRTGRACGGC